MTTNDHECHKSMMEIKKNKKNIKRIKKRIDFNYLRFIFCIYVIAMPSYKCYCCLFETRLKSNYKRHLLTKTHAKNEQKYGDDQQKEYEMTTNDHKMTTNDHKMTTNDHECRYCQKSFSSKAHRSRHERQNCKIQKNEAEMETLKNMIQKQQDVITKLSSGSGSGNGGHNTNSNNNITNNITNNIALNNFRREDVEFITPEMMNALIQKPHTMIPRFIQLVHFNDNVPENNNIRYPNKNENMLVIFIDKDWKYADKDELIDEMIDNKHSDLDEHFDSVSDKMRTNTKKNYIKYSKLLHDKDKELMKTLHNKCNIMLLNSRKNQR